MSTRTAVEQAIIDALHDRGDMTTTGLCDYLAHRPAKFSRSGVCQAVGLLYQVGGIDNSKSRLFAWTLPTTKEGEEHVGNKDKA